MLDTHFTVDQMNPLIISASLLFAAVLTFRRYGNVALTLLILGALGMGFFAANLNSFLEIWDEQFHALVAKNMTSSPFTPRLFPEELLAYDHTNWTNNYIWLHKQPLFLWQMALSIKLFGPTVFAIRIPSIILHAILPFFVYRIGKIIANKDVGFIAALLITVSYFPLELIAGEFATDHNDISFLFYVTGSFWAWFEYQRTHQFKYLIALGLFAGGAVLVKWLMGLIVYVAWTITNLISERLNFFQKKNILPMIQAGSISLLVFLPWQIYIHMAFPEEAMHELTFNGKHFFEAIEGHTGAFSFHFTEGISILYGAGDAIPFLILFGLILLIYKCQDFHQRLFIGISVVFVYLFFSLAATKMIAFTIIVMPFIYLGLAMLIHLVVDKIAQTFNQPLIYAIALPVLTLFLSYSALNLNRIESNHTNLEPVDKQYWTTKTAEKKFILTLNDELNDAEYVIFNCNTSPFAHIPIMFYTNHLAYLKIPTQQDIELVKSKQKKVAVFELGELPEYIKQDTNIYKISVDSTLMRNY